MTNEELIAESVQEWAAEVLPDDLAAAGRAGALAMRCYASGASVNEACGVARRFLGSWSRHPSRGLAAERPLARQAS